MNYLIINQTAVDDRDVKNRSKLLMLLFRKNCSCSKSRRYMVWYPVLLNLLVLFLLSFSNLIQYYVFCFIFNIYLFICFFLLYFHFVYFYLSYFHFIFNKVCGITRIFFKYFKIMDTLFKKWTLDSTKLGIYDTCNKNIRDNQELDLPIFS